MTEEEVIRKLIDVYGFRVPLDFAKILLLAYYDSWHSDRYYSADYFQAYLEQFLSIEGEISAAFMTDDFVWRIHYHKQSIDRNLAYRNLPFEFFSFGEDKELGKVYGFIVHAPELETNDLPIGECSVEFESMEFNRNRPISLLDSKIKVSSPIVQIGQDIQTAFEFILRRKINSRKGDWERKNTLSRANEIMSLFGKKLAENVSPSIENKRFIPGGWHYEPTFDGLDVYAPKEEFFRDYFVETPILKDIYEEKMFVVRGFLDSDLREVPATALRFVRDFYWKNFEKRGYFAEIAPLWASIYEDLGRFLLAKRIFTALEYRK